MITVYTKANCQPCNAVKRWLDKTGLEYTVLDAASYAGRLEAWGARSAPVTVIGDRVIMGFDPDKLHQAVVETAL